MPTTHLGQRYTDHITLRAINVSNTGETIQDIDFSRINPDGKARRQRFRVPGQKVLVVTEIDWGYAYGRAGMLQTLRVFIENIENSSIRHEVLESNVILNSEAYGGTTISMISGFVVSSKGRIVVDTFPGGGKISNIIIRGYLMSAAS